MVPRQTEHPSGAVVRRIPGWIGLIAMLTPTAPLRPAAMPAFPGAEGFGADTPGGRGGKVYVVTTLDDHGRGSLREAVEAEGPRIVVFSISGDIELRGPLEIRNPWLTIAGQTAPGGGICLKGHKMLLRGTHDIVVRHLRVRPGDIAGKGMDAISIGSFGAGGGVSNVVVDHCSASWASDETISVAGPSRNVTVQWCILAECLSRSVHLEGEHSKGSIIGGQGEGISFHHNIYAHIGTRNPKAGSDHLPPEPGVTIDFVNNVIYDWGPRAGYGAAQRVRLNYVCNWLRAGPSTAAKARDFAFLINGSLTGIYLRGNVLQGHPDRSANNILLLRVGDALAGCPAGRFVVPRPWPAAPVTTWDAETARERVLDGCGAVLPRRDAADARIIRSIRQGSGAIIDSQEQVGAWPDLEMAQAPPDGDGDGMPDAWERANGLDPSDPADAGRPAADGYTQIESYINGIGVRPVP